MCIRDRYLTYFEEDNLLLTEWIKEFNVSLCLQSVVSNIDKYQMADDDLTTAEALSDNIVKNILVKISILVDFPGSGHIISITV